MSIKPKVGWKNLKETAEQVIQKLEEEAKDYTAQINLLNDKVNDIERKIRWLQREILS